MLSRVASRVSLRSRERKLQLFLELFLPGPETSVLDVGVTDAPFGGGSTDNFFEAFYPWPERVTAVGRTSLERFAAAFPAVTVVQADGRSLPFADGAFELGFSNAVVEHVGGREEQRRFVHELCRVA
jgi:SAM-dependent methyltransferase